MINSAASLQKFRMSRHFATAFNPFPKNKIMTNQRPPKHLSKTERKVWRILIKEQDNLEQIDELLFMQAVTSAAIMLEAEAAVRSDGLFIEQKILNSRTGVVSEVMVEHPALKIAERHQKVFMSLADRLGWSPAARSRIKTIKPKVETEEMPPNPFTDPPLQNDD